MYLGMLDGWQGWYRGGPVCISSNVAAAVRTIVTCNKWFLKGKRGHYQWFFFPFSGQISRSQVVIQTGKLQPVFIWREKPVLLALLSNLTIPVPASYPVFRS